MLSIQHLLNAAHILESRECTEGPIERPNDGKHMRINEETKEAIKQLQLLKSQFRGENEEEEPGPQQSNRVEHMEEAIEIQPMDYVGTQRSEVTKHLEALKTRLTFARFKVERGWAEKPLNEVDHLTHHWGGANRRRKPSSAHRAQLLLLKAEQQKNRATKSSLLRRKLEQTSGQPLNTTPCAVGVKRKRDAKTDPIHKLSNSRAHLSPLPTRMPAFSPTSPSPGLSEYRGHREPGNPFLLKCPQGEQPLRKRRNWTEKCGSTPSPLRTSKFLNRMDRIGGWWGGESSTERKIPMETMIC
ncbi:uncharacterized protein VTP21DRAFT_2186 [Calcarisporiella thermophila]|uniref:uncharacterized protein n=1 Tax=Calcarisporiella thermophila TaxID=911321 RepID=UPI003742BC4C